ncbi:MAG: hypothetical protein IT355_03925 [Gemmatimonadaceae bacterium]|nr:hypothetical protein [Gemmatimonadaceae bacterium]
MTTIRHRMTVAAITLLTAGLAACANGPTSPIADFNADGDTTGRAPTLPWVDVNSAPTLPWADVNAAPTLPWADVNTAPTLPWVSARRATPAATNH